MWYVRQIPTSSCSGYVCRWQIDGDFSLATAEVLWLASEGIGISGSGKLSASISRW